MLRVLALLLALFAGQAAAQEQDVTGSNVVTLDQERLFAESQFGRAVKARSDAERRDLSAENRNIEASMEAEERDLTVRRPALPVADFRILADAFDVKAEEMRQAQTAKSRAVERRFDEERQQFFQTALPVVGALMAERGAVMIVKREAIVLSLARIDITDAAIARLDAEMGDGTTGVAPQDFPAPLPAPAVVPQAPVAPSP